MGDKRNPTSVEAAVSAATLGQAQATHPPQVEFALATLSLQRRGVTGFTLVELLVTIGVLVILVLLATQLLNSAASITTLGHKQMGADAQARQSLDRMAIDFAQMLKRSDVDYYLKSSATGTGVRYLPQPGNDKIAFYSAVPGYYLPGSTSTAYSSAKAAVHRFSETLSLQLGPPGIPVFSISPGLVRTSMTEDHFPADAPWTPPELAPSLVRVLASGRADALAGRYLHAEHDDVEELIRRAAEIREQDLNAIRLRR